MDVTRIALAIDGEDWHARALVAAFAAAGAEAVPLRLSECAFDTGRPHGVALPGFGDALPDAVLVREIGGGSFEAVTRRLGILHALRDRGVPVWNDARAVERCVDKSATSARLARDGLPTPRSWAVEGLEAARAVVAAQAGTPLVLKPLFGSQGRGLRLAASPADLPGEAELGGAYYLQRYVPPAGEGFRDHRLLVVAGEIAGAMTRTADHWITNLRRGGRAEALEPGPEMRDLAIRAAGSVGAAYAGVDLLRRQDGALLVLEVNSMPGWRGLQTVVPHAIADRIAAALLGAIRT